MRLTRLNAGHAQMRQAVKCGLVRGNPSPNTQLASDVTSLRRAECFPAGPVIGGVFLFVRRLSVHASIEFRSPKKGDANAYESVFLFRNPSES